MEAQKDFGPTPAQKFHGERVAAREQERIDGAINNAKDAAAKAKNEEAIKAFFEDVLGTIVLVGLLSELEKSAAQAPATPFETFWLDLNTKRKIAGQPEANYGEARNMYRHRAQQEPEGAVTFTGRKGVGIRAVPLPHNRGYIADYRTPDNEWHTVGGFMNPTPFRSVDEALKAAAAIHETRT